MEKQRVPRPREPSFEQAANTIERLYREEIARFGVDHVLVLSPFRNKTKTGVNMLNERLQDIANPPAPDKPEFQSAKTRFRLYDRVMQTKNVDDINNGDIGQIRKITQAPDGVTVEIDFGDGREVEYGADQMKMLDLAYASTVHKSQGSERTSVILSLQSGHYPMLKRPLLYTAITRATERVTIVGERRAICIAIKTVDAETRNTNLANRIKSGQSEPG